jgi:hypothetical protein
MGTQSTIAGIPVYVISLKDSETRRRDMTKRLAALGISFQFVDAVDGRTQRMPDTFDGARIVRDAFWGDPVIACTMTHRKVHRMIAEGESELALIFEDDADPSPDFPDALALAPMLRFDILKFEGGAPWGRRAKLTSIGRYNVIVGTPSLGAAAYLITRSAAARFCALPVLDQITDVGFGDLRLGLRVLDLEPYPVKQNAPPQLHPPTHFLGPHKPRLSRLAQLALSVRKRAKFVRLYGLQAAIKMDIGKFTGNTR